MAGAIPTAAIVMPSTAPGHNNFTSSSSSSSSSGVRENTTAGTPSTDLSDAPYLVMLIPTDGIDWGLASGEGEHKGVGGWMEVGCRMTSIRMVSSSVV